MLLCRLLKIWLRGTMVRSLARGQVWFAATQNLSKHISHKAACLRLNHDDRKCESSLVSLWNVWKFLSWTYWILNLSIHQLLLFWCYKNMYICKLGSFKFQLSSVDGIFPWIVHRYYNILILHSFVMFL